MIDYERVMRFCDDCGAETEHIREPLGDIDQASDHRDYELIRYRCTAERLYEGAFDNEDTFFCENITDEWEPVE